MNCRTFLYTRAAGVLCVLLMLGGCALINALMTPAGVYAGSALIIAGAALLVLGEGPRP